MSDGLDFGEVTDTHEEDLINWDTVEDWYHLMIEVEE